MFRCAAFVTAVLLCVGCAPTVDQVREVIESNPDIVLSTIEKNPEIVLAAIEKNPEEFIRVANKASQIAQEKAQESAQQKELSKREQEYQNPKAPALAVERVYFGRADAKITIVEYSDFECPYCSRGYQTVKQVMQEYGDDVRVLYKHLPLEMHAHALPAALLYEAIAQQSAEKARKFHDRLYENQGALRSGGKEWMREVGKDLGVDMAQLEKDVKSEKVKSIVKADMIEAGKFGFSGTPGFLINGVSLKGAYPLPAFKEIIDHHLATM
ncbi:MAG: protein-disulfide isomerase [Candidatus Latescibacterota bacterium]|jgi:protein-disulfide isomerase